MLFIKILFVKVQIKCQTSITFLKLLYLIALLRNHGFTDHRYMQLYMYVYTYTSIHAYTWIFKLRSKAHNIKLIHLTILSAQFSTCKCSVVLAIFTLLCNRFLEHFFIAELRLCTHWITTPHFPPFCFLFLGMTALDTPYKWKHKWKHKVFVLSCLAYLT